MCYILCQVITVLNLLILTINSHTFLQNPFGVDRFEFIKKKDSNIHFVKELILNGMLVSVTRRTKNIHYNT